MLLTGRTVEDQTVFAAVVSGLIPILKPVPLVLSQTVAAKEVADDAKEVK